ncbi:MAG: LamG-like jellyroll fold domain-containing protein [Sedimentisphaerales bacterium]|jgi:hypothetical protein|nr:LamG-like jellyroll fold domain-containing protein [Sedimentisphaerales bacterium]
MFKRSVLVLAAFVTLIPACSAPAIPEDLILYWPFNEGRGTVAKDRSGNGNDGTLEGGVLWGPGVIGAALQFNGSDSLVRGPHIPFDSRSFTHALWVNPSLLAGDQSVFSQYQASSANQGLHYRISAAGGVRMGFYSNDLDLPAGTVQAGTWYHLTFRYDFESQNRRVYINGELAGEGAAAPYLGSAGDTLVGTFWRPDRADRVPEWFNGMIDDVQIYGRALADEEIQGIMLGLADPDLAYDPSPADEAIDVPRDAALSWVAGQSAATHDVYFGTSFDDVNDATRADPRGVLISEGQTDASYEPTGLLDFGTTYYWRIDEISAGPDHTIHRGDVWSFTAEPFAYAVENIIATSNGFSESMSGPERTVDGSGLDADDRHSVDHADMWLAELPDNEPLHLQYEFDRLYKLHQMLVWNYNVEFELLLGLGLKEATVTYSEDGIDWSMLGDVELSQGTAKATYTANTTIDFHGVAARFVRLTVRGAWGGTEQAGLSEVRFLYIPAQAREPQPADGAVEFGVNNALAWRAGRDAVSHDVYLGADPDALEPAATVAGTSYTPGALNLATTYYWQVNAVQETESWDGAVWSFTTQEYLVVDDFESYTDDIDAGEAIFDTWLDGWVNNTGSTVGHLNSPFAEQTIVHSGRQSMPLSYDNTGMTTAEADYALTADWSAHGIRSLSLYFHGAEGNTGQLYVKINGTRIAYDGPASDLAEASWRQWSIDLSQVGDISSVRSLTIGVEGAEANGVIYVDDIRLYP